MISEVPPSTRVTLKGICGIVLVLGVALRVGQYLTCRSLWLDEAMLVANILERSAGELLGPLDQDQVAPMGLLLALKGLTTILGDHELVLRIIPLVASIGALVLFLVLAHRTLEEEVVPLALTVLALTFPSIYYAQEVKQYSTDAAIALALILLGLRVTEAENPDPRHRTVLLWSGVIGLFCSFTAVFVLGSLVGVTSVIHRVRGRSWRTAPMLRCGVVWALAFLLNGVLFLRAPLERPFLYQFWAHGFPPAPWDLAGLAEWYRVIGNLPMMISIRSGILEALSVGLAVLGTVGAIHRRSVPLLVAAGTIALHLVAASCRLYPFAERLVLYLVPMFLLLLAAGLSIIGARLPRRLYLGVLGTLGVSFLIDLGGLAQPIQREESRSALRVFLEERRPADRLYVYYGASNAIRYYLRRWPVPEHLVHHGVRAREEPERYLTDLEALKSAPRVWYLFGHVHANEETFITKNLDGRPIVERRFPGASLYLFERAGQAHD